MDTGTKRNLCRRVSAEPCSKSLTAQKSPFRGERHRTSPIENWRVDHRQFSVSSLDSEGESGPVARYLMGWGWTKRRRRRKLWHGELGRRCKYTESCLLGTEDTGRQIEFTRHLVQPSNPCNMFPGFQSVKPTFSGAAKPHEPDRTYRTEREALGSHAPKEGDEEKEAILKQDRMPG
ncbi:hypothetical protein LZ30DRAFT_685901 [Colletotrichum cereale]|nr:hypothetical protein LZ30DRAFT_685901 [Colletotrichum cereale]